MSDTQSLIADKLAVAELAQLERLARDRKQWEVMAECYHPDDSRVFLSWYDGDAAGFIAASRAMASEPGGHVIHFNGPTLVRVAGDRALAETACAILMRRTVEGIECDLTAHCRHHSRVERLGERWALRTLVGVYEKNTLVPTVPGVAPEIDESLLRNVRQSYNYQTYFRLKQGKPAFDDRPGLDRPETVQRLLDAEEQWLAGEEVPLGVGALA